MKHQFPRFSLSILIILMAISLFSSKKAQAYFFTKDRPVFLAWPLPSYIGVARVSQFPNTPWTWNYLGLNAGMQCTPAFGYLESWLPTWRDASIPWEQDAAQADPHQFQMIACYSTGGEAGANGHEGTDIKAPAGTPVLASADGKVAGWRIWDVNTMLVLKHCLGGTWDADNECSGGVKWYTTYMHITIDPTMQQMDLDVQKSTSLGKIYNQGDNSHLHFEVGLEQRNYENYINPWGQDEAPWLSCMWEDETLCVIPEPARKQFLLQVIDGREYLKKFYSGFHELPEVENAVHYQVAGDRIGVLTGDRIFFMLSRDSKWVEIAKDVSAFQITENRMAVLKNGGALHVHEGEWTGQWDLQVGGIDSFFISEHRVGALNANGELFVIEGDLIDSWIFSAKDVDAFQLIDTRIAYVDLQGNLLVQEGVLDSEWKLMFENVKAFQLSGVRVAVLNEKDELWVNHGNLRADFVFQSENVLSFQLSDDRIIVHDHDGTWRLKQGSLFDGWIELSFMSSKVVVLNNSFPVYID